MFFFMYGITVNRLIYTNDVRLLTCVEYSRIVKRMQEARHTADVQQPTSQLNSHLAQVSIPCASSMRSY